MNEIQDTQLDWVSDDCKDSYKMFVAKYAALTNTDTASLLNKVEEMEIHCERVVPEMGDRRIKEFYTTHGFQSDDYRVPVENLKQVLTGVDDFTTMKRMIGSAVFETSLERDVYQEADMIFREVRMNPIVRVEVTENCYRFFSKTDVYEAPYSDGICEIRGKLVLLPPRLQDRFEVSRYLNDAIRRVGSQVFKKNVPITLKEGEKFLHKTLPAVRDRNPDDFYAINDMRGILARSEVYDSYLIRAYIKMFLDNPTIGSVAILDPTPRDMDLFRKILRELYLRTRNEIQLIEMNGDLAPDPTLLVLKSAFDHHLGSSYYFDLDEDLADTFYQRVMMMYGNYMGPHVGVSRISLPFNSYPFPTGYEYMVSKGKRYVPFSVQSSGLNVGLYFSLPHRTRNVAMFKHGVKFSSADWSLIRGKLSPRPLGPLLLRLEHSLRRNMQGLDKNSVAFKTHQSLSLELNANQGDLISKVQRDQFREDFEHIQVYCQDTKKRLTLSKPKFDFNVIAQLVRAIPIGKDNAIPRYKIKLKCQGHKIDDLISYAVASGMVAEVIGHSYVMYYVVEKEDAPEMEIPGVRSNVVVTDGYGIMGALMTPDPVVFDVTNVNKSFYASMFQQKFGQRTIDTGKSTPKLVKKRHQRRFNSSNRPKIHQRPKVKRKSKLAVTNSKTRYRKKS